MVAGHPGYAGDVSCRIAIVLATCALLTGCAVDRRAGEPGSVPETTGTPTREPSASLGAPNGASTGDLGFSVAGPMGSPPVPNGWNPDGRHQIVTYSRVAADAVRVGVKVQGPIGQGFGFAGGNGCQAVDYPFTLSVGPFPEGPSDRYQQVMSSGGMSGGTLTLWYDITSVGITIGWGKPEWGQDDVAMDCGGWE